MNTFKTLPMLTALCTLVAYSFAAPVQNLAHILQAERISIEFTSLGGHRGETIQMKATNLSREEIITGLEPGRILVACESTWQDLLVTQELLFALAPGETIEKVIVGFCMQSQDASPLAGGNYNLGPMGDKLLIDLAHYINGRPDLEKSAVQHAIWTISDCHPVSSISRSDEETTELSDYVAGLLGLPPTWYVTEHPQRLDRLFSTKVEKVKGQMPFSIAQAQRISVVIVNADGKPVKTLLSSAFYGPGEYSYPLDLRVSSWPSGNYKVLIGSTTGELKTYVFSI